MLFDDRKFPYHLMLQNFVVNGGQDSFFDCFKISIMQNDFLKSSENPDGIIEFIDSWLLLLEKMANPQTLLDSPHSLPAKADARSTTNYVPFDPVKYLIRTHKVSLTSRLAHCFLFHSLLNAPFINRKLLPVFLSFGTISYSSLIARVLSAQCSQFSPIC